MKIHYLILFYFIGSKSILNLSKNTFKMQYTLFIKGNNWTRKSYLIDRWPLYTSVQVKFYCLKGDDPYIEETGLTLLKLMTEQWCEYRIYNSFIWHLMILDHWRRPKKLVFNWTSVVPVMNGSCNVDRYFDRWERYGGVKMEIKVTQFRHIIRTLNQIIM